MRWTDTGARGDGGRTALPGPRGGTFPPIRGVRMLADGSKWSQQLSLPSDVTSPSRARSFVRAELSAHDLSYLAEDVELVVSELATNALLHAGTAMVVTLAEDRVELRLTVRDDAPLF